MVLEGVDLVVIRRIFMSRILHWWCLIVFLNSTAQFAEVLILKVNSDTDYIFKISFGFQIHMIHIHTFEYLISLSGPVTCIIQGMMAGMDTRINVGSYGN